MVVRGEGGRGRVTSGHIPPPQPPAQAGPASTAACDTRELHKVREENLQNDSIFIQCLISLTYLQNGSWIFQKLAKRRLHVLHVIFMKILSRYWPKYFKFPFLSSICGGTYFALPVHATAIVVTGNNIFLV